jgi:hypothetical protein
MKLDTFDAAILIFFSKRKERKFKHYSVKSRGPGLSANLYNWKLLWSIHQEKQKKKKRNVWVRRGTNDSMAGKGIRVLDCLIVMMLCTIFSSNGKKTIWIHVLTCNVSIWDRKDPPPRYVRTLEHVLWPLPSLIDLFFWEHSTTQTFTNTHVQTPLCVSLLTGTPPTTESIAPVKSW